MQTDANKSHPDLLQKFDQLDQQLKIQPNLLLEPIKQILLEQQNQTRKIGEEKLGKIPSEYFQSISIVSQALCSEIMRMIVLIVFRYV